VVDARLRRFDRRRAFIKWCEATATTRSSATTGPAGRSPCSNKWRWPRWRARVPTITPDALGLPAGEDRPEHPAALSGGAQT